MNKKSRKVCLIFFLVMSFSFVHGCGLMKLIQSGIKMLTGGNTTANNGTTLSTTTATSTTTPTVTPTTVATTTTTPTPTPTPTPTVTKSALPTTIEI